MTYGSDVFAMTFGDPEGRSDPMNMVFPKVVVMLMVLMVTAMMKTDHYHFHDHGKNDDKDRADNEEDKSYVPEVKAVRNSDNSNDDR